MQSKKRNKRETGTTYLFKRERCDEEKVVTTERRQKLLVLLRKRELRSWELKTNE
jgi:hypothetical protein